MFVEDLREYARGGLLRVFFSVTVPDFGWTALGGRGGISDFFLVVSVAVASLGEDFSVVVVAFFSVLALAGAGVFDHLHLTL